MSKKVNAHSVIFEYTDRYTDVSVTLQIYIVCGNYFEGKLRSFYVLC